jgi:hypothetical protein
MSTLEMISISSCPVCNAFPVQLIAAPGDTTAFKFIPSRNVKAIDGPTTALSGLEWSATLCNGERVNHAKAEAACSALGEGWRLPTRVELLSLVDDTRTEPAIDVSRFPDTKSGAYWTSTLYASGSSYAWVVNFGYGLADYGRRGNGYAFVRAVRSVPAGQ